MVRALDTKGTPGARVSRTSRDGERDLESMSRTLATAFLALLAPASGYGSATALASASSARRSASSAHSFQRTRGLLLRGGSDSAPSRRGSTAAPMLIPTPETPPTPVERFRKDWAPPPYRIEAITMDINIRDGSTLVTSTLTVQPQDNAADQPLDLDGVSLALLSIELNGEPLAKDAFTLTYDGLRVFRPPSGATFSLKTVVEIEPEKNTQLSGLYKSGNAYITHNEAQGFRRITFFQDRPDIMAKYDCRIEADKAKYPLLLANGNEMEHGDLPEGRHWASFSDPFRKPSYLFCAVAGDLGGIQSTFTTKSGREVALKVWSEKENVDELDWAMQSLKDSMTWDENTYGREYDLDVYHIVAVNDFNMGAMENKGLNVFNTAVLLAKPSTATDTDYERVQGVVGHEYFHNWSGNRVTVRDWFQLSLKEGLTNFRQQGFEEDMTSYAVRRIEEARVIRSAQFVQDAGPMAHSVRPESYSAIDNFYTVTVYNKVMVPSVASVAGMWQVFAREVRAHLGSRLLLDCSFGCFLIAY